ncbi:MAG TPA: inorganic phosphate transporter [Candidatus Kapabacteria bacterium]|nr:inorganic phosphate transporter [Candidatus Kapabacteria bacterium]
MSFDINLLMVILLLILAAVNLTVGVANDAINFLNSALGSKAAKFKTALTVAAIGVFTGIFFSNGMIEVARTGVFNPERFNVTEVLIIFLAMIYAQVLLIDLFNTFGLPTSTTVSLVFTLLGASVAISAIKVINVGGEFSTVYEYLNLSSLLNIIVGIISSIFFAFIFGYLFQFLTRMIFTFDYIDKFKKYGAIWSGVALSMIFMFIFMKGAKGATFVSEGLLQYINNNVSIIVCGLIVFWTIVIQLLMWFTKINMLKVIVLVGTFGLALAFSANDLVNFIGAPLAGLSAYYYYLADPNTANQTMAYLTEPVKADMLILLLSGVIMVITLYFSKKAQNVAKTELNLGRQDEGAERFESNVLARLLVRIAIDFAYFILKITPPAISNKISKRFDLSKYKPIIIEGEQPPSFDLIRAAVILVVSSGLISFATSLQLPLSTTYVTFIVAMAAALPDKAWGRDSAVYRVSGVITVVAGWFFTGVMATIMASIIALILYFGSYFGVLGVGLFVVVAFIRTGKMHKEKEREEEEKLRKLLAEKENPDKKVEFILNSISDYINKHTSILLNSFESFFKPEATNLKANFKLAKKLDDEGSTFIKNILKLYIESSPKVPDDGYLYTKSILAFQELGDRLIIVTKQNHKYIDNNHNQFTNDQIRETKELLKSYEEFALKIADRIIKSNFENDEEIDFMNVDINVNIKSKIDFHLHRMLVKKNINFKRSTIYMSTLIDIEMFAKDLLFIYQATKDSFMYYIEHKN